MCAQRLSWFGVLLFNTHIASLLQYKGPFSNPDALVTCAPSATHSSCARAASASVAHHSQRGVEAPSLLIRCSSSTLSVFVRLPRLPRRSSPHRMLGPRLVEPVPWAHNALVSWLSGFLEGMFM